MTFTQWGNGRLRLHDLDSPKSDRSESSLQIATYKNTEVETHTRGKNTEVETDTRGTKRVMVLLFSPFFFSPEFLLELHPT